jgi:hypothetical protein
VPERAENCGHQRSPTGNPNDLQPGHAQVDPRLLVQAIMALAEADYRRAAIDAGTASEVALASAISELLEAKELNREYIDQTIRRSDGFDALFSLHLSFGRPKPISRNAPVSRNAVITQLANVRNDSAHAGRIPLSRKQRVQ